MLVVCCVFSHTNEDDHGSHQGNMARELAQWQCLVASREATVALHRAMLIAFKRPGGMVIKITGKFATFVYIVYNRVAK
jgi:hypothetical protein